MKHAGPAALDRIEDFLAAIRALNGLRERSRGVFYRSGQAFLHFHEDPSGLHADLRTGAEFTRFRAESAGERRALLAALRRQLRPASR